MKTAAERKAMKRIGNDKSTARIRLKMLYAAKRRIRTLEAANEKLKVQQAALREQVAELKMKVIIAKPLLRLAGKKVRW